ncbi:amidohydrolase family protein [Pseudonocardia nematodicida]|uniref:Amidohydrolase family protein n=1 Tax=Pseudonocardia nematodicida TaxID=1206997 RepID=A0ABV1K3C3_9PSEU
MSRQAFVAGKVFTGEDESRVVTAFRVNDGLVEWTGDVHELDPAERRSAIDLEGRTVLPGLLDMHLHPAVMASLADAVECLPPRVRSVDELVATLRCHPALGAGPDVWIVGTGYDEAVYPEHRHPTARDLDRVSTTQPVLVWRADRHSAVCNTRALEIAGITAATPDPPGSRFGRDETGRPDGILTERDAAHAVARHVPERTAAEFADLLGAVGERLLARGIVGVCDLMATALPDPLATYRSAAGRRPFPRSALFLGWDPAAPLPDLTEDERTGPVRVGGVKVLMDGTYSGRTAWVCHPYPESDDHGLRAVTDDDLCAARDWARRNEVQLAVHAMGDRAIAHVVDLLGDDEPWLTDQPSVRIEHATLMSPELVDRLRTTRMSFGIATHTVFLFAEYAAYARNLRPEQLPDAYPVRTLYGAVDALALSSDCPATAWSEADDVFVSVEAAVRRRAHNGEDIGQDAAVTVAQALLLYTSRAAGLTRLTGLAGPSRLGTIAPGREASFVVLDRDVLTVPSEEISRVRVDETWLAGRRVYRR